MAAASPGPPNSVRSPPAAIEQISREQLLPVKTTRFHFTAVDKRSASICTPQLSGIQSGALNTS